MTSWALCALGALAILLLALAWWFVSDAQRGRARARLTLVTQDTAPAAHDNQWSVAAISARIDREHAAATPTWPTAEPNPCPGNVLPFRPQSQPARQRPYVQPSLWPRQPLDPARLRPSRERFDRL
jgi:hypothetical protein